MRKPSNAALSSSSMSTGSASSSHLNFSNKTVRSEVRKDLVESSSGSEVDFLAFLCYNTQIKFGIRRFELEPTFARIVCSKVNTVEEVSS